MEERGDRGRKREKRGFGGDRKSSEGERERRGGSVVIERAVREKGREGGWRETDVEICESGVFSFSNTACVLFFNKTVPLSFAESEAVCMGEGEGVRGG